MRLRKKKWKPTGVKKDRSDDPMVVAPVEMLAQRLQEKFIGQLWKSNLSYSFNKHHF